MLATEPAGAPPASAVDAAVDAGDLTFSTTMTTGSAAHLASLLFCTSTYTVVPLAADSSSCRNDDVVGSMSATAPALAVIASNCAVVSTIRSRRVATTTMPAADPLGSVIV
jgi:hypothetical protein